MNDEQRWRLVIDGLHADLDHAEASAANDEFAALAPFRPAGDLGPLPADYVDEIRALSRRHDAIVADLAGRRRPPVRDGGSSRPSIRSSSHFEARA